MFKPQKYQCNSDRQQKLVHDLQNALIKHQGMHITCIVFDYLANHLPDGKLKPVIDNSKNKILR